MIPKKIKELEKCSELDYQETKGYIEGYADGKEEMKKEIEKEIDECKEFEVPLYNEDFTEVDGIDYHISKTELKQKLLGGEDEKQD
jgi:hypothetical protein